MLDIDAAAVIILKNIPIGVIQSAIEYRDLYLFKVFTTRVGEEQMDPFYSVDKMTGAFSEFSIITDGDTSEILELFRGEERKASRP